MKLKKRKGFIISSIIILIGLLLPQNFTIPVEGATKGDWNNESFWFYPWGKSVTHMGVDIFASEGKNVVSSTFGFVVYKGKLERGGNVIFVLGPKWRLHYYAHLKEIHTTWFNYVKKRRINW